MKHILFGSNTDKLKVAILIKESALNQVKMERYYTKPCSSIETKNFIALSLWYNDKKKAPAKIAREYLTELLPEITELNVNTLLVCDAPYFKFLSGMKKAEPYYGYVVPCIIKGFENLNIILCPNYQAMLYAPELQKKIDRALEALTNFTLGIYTEPGKGIIDTSYYPETSEDIKKSLDSLKDKPELAADIEAAGLEFWNCGISSIAFAWDKHNGIAFGVDREIETEIYPIGQNIPVYRNTTERDQIRKILLDFLITYKGKLTWHNISYDAKVLVYNLWMKHLADYKKMITGIKVMTKNFDDTKLITYMATNNAVKNELGLKAQSCEFTGNYAQEDIKDTDKIAMPALLKYNLKDCLATWYVKEKHYQTMVDDKQLELYEGLMKDTVRTLMQTELCGMPVNPEKVQNAKAKLTKIYDKCHDYFKSSNLVQDFHMAQLIAKAEKKTLAAAAAAKTNRATKIYTWEDSVIFEEFNPNSNTQLQNLLYEYLKYPVIDYTKAKAPSTGKKTIEKLLNHATCDEHKKIFEQLIKLSEASIILSTFIPAFENAQQLPDGSWRLFGNFNIGGTQSLRLSSSNINLQNIPSGSTFAKLVKECFMPIAGWLFGGSDFNSLTK